MSKRFQGALRSAGSKPAYYDSRARNSASTRGNSPPMTERHGQGIHEGALLARNLVSTREHYGQGIRHPRRCTTGKEFGTLVPRGSTTGINHWMLRAKNSASAWETDGTIYCLSIATILLREIRHPWRSATGKASTREHYWQGIRYPRGALRARNSASSRGHCGQGVWHHSTSKEFGIFDAELSVNCIPAEQLG